MPVGVFVQLIDVPEDLGADDLEDYAVRVDIFEFEPETLTAAYRTIGNQVGSDRKLDAQATEIASITCMAVAQKRQMGTEALLALVGRRRLSDTYDVLSFS